MQLVSGAEVGFTIQAFRICCPQSEASTLWLKVGNSTTQPLESIFAASSMRGRSENGSNLPCRISVGMFETTGS